MPNVLLMCPCIFYNANSFFTHSIWFWMPWVDSKACCISDKINKTVTIKRHIGKDRWNITLSKNDSLKWQWTRSIWSLFRINQELTVTLLVIWNFNLHSHSQFVECRITSQVNFSNCFTTSVNLMHPTIPKIRNILTIFLIYILLKLYMNK